MISVKEFFLILSGISLSIEVLSMLTALYKRAVKLYLYYGIFSVSVVPHSRFFNYSSGYSHQNQGHGWEAFHLTGIWRN